MGRITRASTRGSLDRVSQKNVTVVGMAIGGVELNADDRVELLRIVRSRQTPRGVAARARIVLDCAECSVAESARRSYVSRPPRTSSSAAVARDCALSLTSVCQRWYDCSAITSSGFASRLVISQFGRT